MLCFFLFSAEIEKDYANFDMKNYKIKTNIKIFRMKSVSNHKKKRFLSSNFHIIHSGIGIANIFFVVFFYAKLGIKKC